LSMAVLVATVHLTTRDALSVVYDFRPLAQSLKTYEDQGVALANFGNYHGQYQFLGRLTHPMAVLGLDQKVTDAFVAAHPDGLIVAYYSKDYTPVYPQGVKPLETYWFGDSKVVLWRAGLLARYPDLANRS